MQKFIGIWSGRSNRMVLSKFSRFVIASRPLHMGDFHFIQYEPAGFGQRGFTGAIPVSAQRFPAQHITAVRLRRGPRVFAPAGKAEVVFMSDRGNFLGCGAIRTGSSEFSSITNKPRPASQ